MSRYAFTLAELMVSLAVLGLISALTIPNIFNSLEKQKKRAVLGEAMATMQASLKEGFKAGNPLNSDASIEAWLSQNLAVAEECPANTTKKQCWFMQGTTGEFAFSRPFRKYLLPTGALVWVYAYNGGNPGRTHPGVVIDWNGSKGVGVPGDDFIFAIFNNESDTLTYLASTYSSTPPRSGELRVPDAPVYAGYKALLEDIY